MQPAPGPAWLILPTFNEAENIEAVVARVLPTLRATGGDASRVLIVDDGSPDGTGGIANRLAAKHEHVEVLHRKVREGLGRAYTAGFAVALARGGEFVLEMDADLSHDPADVGRLLTAAHAGADVVLGSRYVPGGSIEGWGALRRVVSRGGSTYARLILGLDVRDLTGGFKCFHRRVLESIELETVRARGYAFQIELTYRAVRNGFRIEEVPIVFRDRVHGRSKMSPAIALEAMWLVPLMRWQR